MNRDANLVRVGEKVHARRRELRITSREELADLCGLSTRVLGTVERGDHAVSAGTYAQIEQALGWAPGSVATIAAGGEPTVTSSAALHTMSASELQRLADQQWGRERIGAFTTADRVVIKDFIDELGRQRFSDWDARFPS
ncbi:helix-turn-helix domain-containing protein [Nocardia sp. NPDC050435]|uniref:helix-turn-helix domain-containing protein n=1 Tax=Nocardia sp. NPDC050435 TaxID=3155040 RepID=UPI0033F9C6DC